MRFQTFLQMVFPELNPFLRKEKGVMCNLCKWISLRIAYAFFKMGISANVLDIVGILYSFSGFYLFSRALQGEKNMALVGIAMILSHVLIDFIDGSISKGRKYSSKIGELLDNSSIDIDRLIVFILIGVFSKSIGILIGMMIAAFTIIYLFPNTVDLVPDKKWTYRIKSVFCNNKWVLGVRFTLGILPIIYASILILDGPFVLFSRVMAGIYILQASIWLIVLMPEYPEINTFKQGVAKCSE